MAITAQRSSVCATPTGAGMLDAKKALEEADGDFEKAIEVLRIKGAAKVQKRGAERTASAGLVANSGGALVELNSETDFVAKSDSFIALADQIVAAAEQAQAERRGDPQGRHAGRRQDGRRGDRRACRRHRREARARPGRVLRRSTIALHAPPLERPAAGRRRPGRVRGRQRRCRPRRRHADRGDASAVRHPRRDPRRARRQGARDRRGDGARGGQARAGPATIVEGRLNGFYKDVVLLEQASVQDSKRTVQAMLDEAGVTVTRFARFEVGS